MTQNGLHAAAEPQASQAPLGRHGHRPPNAPWRRPICRTSRLEPQANGPFPSRSDCSEKQCRQTCRSPRERRREDQTTDAMDIEVPETRFRGRSHALLYNEERQHQSLGYRTPRQIYQEKACGYVDDRLCRPAALPPLSRASSESGEMLAFAHIPTGTAANKGFDIDEVNSRLTQSAVAISAIGADIETGRATP